MMVGMKPIANLVQDFGVYQSLPKQLAMVLGAGETTLLKLTTAYAMIANGGNRIKARFINTIQDHDGESIDEELTDEDNTFSEKRRNAIRDLSSMLHLVVEKGTARKAIKPIADKYKTPIAGKTGTTNDYKDAWFIGYADDIVIGVFLGYPKPKNLGQGMTGGVLAAPIAAKFLDQYFALYPPFNQRQCFNISGDIGKLLFPFPSITVTTISHFNWTATLKIRFDSRTYFKRALGFF
jgi:penicillin-binding protein 1A